MGKHAVGRFASFALFVVAACACVALAPAARADTRSELEVTVDRHAVRNGEQFTATGTATTTCQWILEWNGDRRVGHARTLVAPYTAPQVTRPTRIPLHGTCFYGTSRTPPVSAKVGTAAGDAPAAAQRITVTVPSSWRQTVVITVLPPSTAVSPPTSSGGPGHPGAGLPITGGPAFLTLLAALGTVLVGTVLVRSSRRRRPALG